MRLCEIQSRTFTWDEKRSLAGGIELHLDRHVLDAADEAGAQAGNRTRQLRVLHSFDYLAEDCFQLQPREVGPEAEMLADSERDVRIRVAPDVEFERFVEHFLVTVRRGIEQADGFSSRDLLAADLGVFRRSARELDHRRGPSHDLFDG